MTGMLVKFEKPNQVVDFANTINRYDHGVDIKYGSHMVDTKSILDVLYPAVFRIVELALHAEESNYKDLKQRLAKSMVQD